MKVSYVLSALIMAHKRACDVSARSAKEANRLEALRAVVTDHNDWVLGLAVPKGTARRRHTTEIPLLAEAFLFIFAVQAARYVYSWRDEHVEQHTLGGPANHLSFPNDDRLTAAMRAVFVRTFSYHTLFAMVALARNRYEVLHPDLRVHGAPTVTDERFSLHRRNLILIHAMPSIPAVMMRISSGSKGSLTPFEPGPMSQPELDIIWTPTTAEQAANSPFGKRRDIESVWDIVEAETRKQNATLDTSADKPLVTSNNPGNPPSASCPDLARAEFPPQKKRALQDKLSQNPSEGIISPAHGASVGLVVGRARGTGGAGRTSTLYAFQSARDPGTGGSAAAVPGIATQDAAY
jgi:hypothetical protein